MLMRKLALCVALAAAAGAVAAQPMEEVPFITTPDNVTLEMLNAATVAAGDYVIDLGSGDGRIVITAAKRFGARGLGVEIVPDLIRQSRDNAQKAGVADKVEFREQDLFVTDLAPASVVTMYLLPEFNLKLRPVLLKLKPGTRIVSHDWDMGDWAPDRTSTVAVPDKKVGLDKSSKVHFWVVPVNAAGLWCGTGLLKGTAIRLEQTYQAFRGTLTRGDRERKFEGRIEGNKLHSTTGSAAQLGLEVQGDQLKIVSAPGNLALLQGMSFHRTGGASCS
jgi:SAM-dependent methyltransferase